MDGGDWFAGDDVLRTRRGRAWWLAPVLCVSAIPALGAPADARAQESALREASGEVSVAATSNGASDDERGAAELADPRAAWAPAPSDEGIFTGRRARRFSVLVGASVGLSDDPRFAASLLPEIGFYARLSEWASVGMRLRVGGGWSSLDGAHLRLALAMPSVRAHFREDLGSWGTIELGVHADGGLALDWMEDRRLGTDMLSFGLGAGAYATLELGDAHGITLDATMMAWGLGGTRVSIDTSVSLSYALRFE